MCEPPFWHILRETEMNIPGQGGVVRGYDTPIYGSYTSNKFNTPEQWQQRPIVTLDEILSHYCNLVIAKLYPPQN